MSVRGRRLLVSLVSGAVLVTGGTLAVPPAPASADAVSDASALRVGVLALAASISAVGQTPALATPLPFTTTSLADVLDIDGSLSTGIKSALVGKSDLKAALGAIQGVTVLPQSTSTSVSFTYARTVTEKLELVHDDGDLRFGKNDGAGNITVALSTRASSPFTVAVDSSQSDPLLRVALVSQPLMDLAVDVETPQLKGFGARQGFTDVDVTGGHYRAHRTQTVTMRDPDGRGLLTLEDLRYSTLPDLFRVTTQANTVDVGLDLALPSTIGGGSGATRTGSLVLKTSGDPGTKVWPTASDATRTYGAELAQATQLSMADGLTSLAQYTGSVLALQDAADVRFPNLDGSTTDLFAPGDDLLDLLSTAAAAQVTCGASPADPPTGVAAPGDTVYCQATTGEGLGTISGISWSLKDQGSITSEPAGAVGPDPIDVIKVDGSDGEPDLQVSFTAGDEPLTARSMPRTVQDVVSRINKISADSQATATLKDGRLDVAVSLDEKKSTAALPLGNATGLGALVGLTGLTDPAAASGTGTGTGTTAASKASKASKATASASATNSTFDVGFGIETGTPAAGKSRATYLLPRDASLLQVGGLSAGSPQGLENLSARIGFLGVRADVTGLGLGVAGTGDAVTLSRVVPANGSATTPLKIDDLFGKDGALDPDAIRLTSAVTASIGFKATEKPVSGSTYATGTKNGASGTVTVEWPASGLPRVEQDAGYAPLRVFDPVPARFLSGTTTVKTGGADKLASPDTVSIQVTSLPGTQTLYQALNVDPGTGGKVEVARQLVSDGLGCQTVTITADRTLTCDGLAPNGLAALQDGAGIQMIVMGDPFALRDSVIDGLSTAMSELAGTDADNVEDDGFAADQYTSTLPLVGLTPAQLAVERDALSTGLAALAEAATADEQGKSATPVSSAQELDASLPTLVAIPGNADDFRPVFALTLGTDQLGIELSAQAPQSSVLTAPLRFDDAGTTTGQQGRGQVTSGTLPNKKAAETVDVDVISTTTLAVTIDRTTARPVVAKGSGSDSRATITGAKPVTAGFPLQAGVAALTAQDPSTLDLGVRVVTDYAPDAKVFTTRRSGTQAGGAGGEAAHASLTVGTGDVITYAAKASDSAGGEGAKQPAPDPMQVKFLAEGLDGLAAAIDDASDGSATRNADASGAPVSAPLIGTDLGAGAEVPETLTGLTSDLRDQLALPAVATATTATALADAVKAAVVAAVAPSTAAGKLDVVKPADVTVTVTCGAGACQACPAVDPAVTPPLPPCTTDGPTGWKTVTVATTLKGLKKTNDAVPFETGLDGLEVRSNQSVTTETDWTLPITLRLERGVGPQVVINTGDKLTTNVKAAMPSAGIDGIMGYLPVHLSGTGAGLDGVPHDGSVATTITITPTAAEPTPTPTSTPFDLFDLYDGKLAAKPTFVDTPGAASEKGLVLGFQTLATDKGVLDLSGHVDVPWTASKAFADPVGYHDVRLDVGKVAASVATPFAVVDPYLAPVRDVVDVLRSKIPVISDLSELAGGGEVSLLSLLSTLSAATKKPTLELATRVIGLVSGVTTMIGELAKLQGKNGEGKVLLSDVEGAGGLLSIDPKDVKLKESCKVSTATTTTNPTTGAKTTTTTPYERCEDAEAKAEQAKAKGAPGQTTGEKRKGTRKPAKAVKTKTREITGSLPGFSLPFLADTDQIMDVLTGEGEASYFRLDLGTLAAQVAYKQTFGPIMAGPIPIQPFVGGSISIEGRLAMGFDSYPQTLAAQAVNPGDAKKLVESYGKFDAGNVIREGFYIDDLDADGADVPEVKLVTTLEAGAGISIGIVTAGLKGSVTLTVNLDLNDPNDDGRLRTAEIRNSFGGSAKCIFDADANIRANISVYVEIELLFTSLDYSYSLLDLGPYELFKYGCPDAVPTLVTGSAASPVLTLTSGNQSGSRISGAADVADDFEVRQFATSATVTRYEVSGFGRVQTVDVEQKSSGYHVTIYDSGITVSTTKQKEYDVASAPTFQADGGTGDDTLSFLAGEEFVTANAKQTLVNTPFSTRVTSLDGGEGNDALVTGSGNDSGIRGGTGNDSITLGDGDDVAHGDAGNDTVSGGAGRDDLHGGADGDRLQGGPGADRVNGEEGNDSLVGGSGRDVRALLVQPLGKDGAVVAEQVRAGFDSGDVVVGGPGVDSVDGGDGSDVVVGGAAKDLADASLGSLFTPDGTRTVNVLVQGTSTNEITTQTVKVDTAKVPGDAQLDTLCVSGAAASGAAEQDFVTGGAEKDVVIGGNGPDVLDGGAGPDEICGLNGDDQISGDAATVSAASADGTQDADVVRGGAGDDRVDAGPGDDKVYGDDVTLVRTVAGAKVRVLDGSLAGTGSGDGKDYLDGGVGNDTIAGGAGADLLLGSAGNDATFGEGRDTVAANGTAPSTAVRLLDCNATTRVVGGLVDLNNDLLAGGTDNGSAADTGRLAGLDVVDGKLLAPDGTSFSGLLGGSVTVVDGRIDLDRDGLVTAGGDSGLVPLASMVVETGAKPVNPDGDCVLSGDGDDQLGGGTGSDYLGAGAGTDLVDGGDGNDLLLGDDGTDVLLGGPHHDVLVGGLGDDSLVGGDGDDRLRGNEGRDDLVGGSTAGGATDGQDVLLGGPDQDVLVGENATAVSSSIVTAVSAASWVGDPAVPSAVTAGATSTLRFPDSALDCSGAPTSRWLTVQADDGKPGQAEKSPGTPLAYDELYGGDECDVVIGSAGDDVVRGGPGGDLVEGGPGNDLAGGDDGDDVVVGGSSFDPTEQTRFTTARDGSGVPDGNDTVRGDGGPDGVDGADLVAGDNALALRLPVAGASTWTLRLLDVATTTSTPAAGTGGNDTIYGDGLADRVFAQGGNDTVSGGAGGDYLEGGDGADTLTGDADADTVLGGSSAADGRPLGASGTRLADTLTGAFDSSSAGVLDRGTDVIDAGSGADVVLGDNGRVTRPAGAERQVARADEAGATDVSGSDAITGGSDDDLLLGEGGDDTVDAGSGADHVEGNEGGDTLLGGTESDVVIGGSSLSPDGRGSLDDAVRAARTQLDAGDTLFGDAPAASAVPGSPDLLLGDNATVLLVGGRRVVQLADVAATSSTPAALTSGNDLIDGGLASPGVGDQVFGQGGNDTVTTGSGDDYVEGGAGNDTLTSTDGDDDVLGGASALDGRPLGDTGTRLLGDGEGPQDAAAARLLDGADAIDLGTGDDVVLGDNGMLTRPAGAGTATRADGTRLRTVQLHDVATATSPLPAGVGGSDRIVAGEGRDLVFGQAGDDTALGDGDVDYLEGGSGSDTLTGGTGEDDLVGGGSSNDGSVVSVAGTRLTDRLLMPVTVATDASAAGLLDGNDILDGGDSRDVLLGDNGRITRDGPGQTLSGGASGPHVIRRVAMADQGPGVWAGSDRLYGGLGDDDLYGQFDSTLTRRPQQTFQGQRVQGDVLDGGAGDDALLGDQGVDVPTPATSLGAAGRTVTDRSRFLRELVRPAGSLVKVVTLSQATLGGDDLLLGGDGSDSVHAGAGKDVANAGAGDDVVFGADGSDALWGGSGHDRVFGGTGNDLLDIKKRARDAALWHLAAPVEDTDLSRRTLNGRDVLFGGAGADGLQADMGDDGTSRKAQGDRLVDWSRSINHYEVCRSGYGYGQVLNTPSSSIISTLNQLAVATGSVGSSEVAIPGRERFVPYPDSRKFVCETR